MKKGATQQQPETNKIKGLDEFSSQKFSLLGDKNVWADHSLPPEEAFGRRLGV
jgi:hypothetical protein